MEEVLNKILDRIFNNWTALRLAVENSFRGPNSLQVAKDFKSYMLEYCKQNNLEVEDIEDELENLLDQEFDTICEDNSIKEISIIIYRFLQLLKENNLEQCEIEFNQLPEANVQWLTMPVTQQQMCPNEGSDSSSDDEPHDTPMEEDSEWTVVKTRKRK